MHPFPHTYHAAAAAEFSGPVAVTSAELPRLETAPPPEFDGPGGVWSPETLLCASLARLLYPHVSCDEPGRAA